MDENNQEENTGNINQWLQDNLRIIISIIIVIAIAGGIYSYSKRSQEAVIAVDESAEEISLDNSTLSDEENATVADESEEVAAITETDDTEKTAAEKTETAVPEQEAPTVTSKETEGSFIETAGKGDGTTHLARRALANYLEKSPDSELKAEQKIYIEDYMRKKVGSQRLSVGTSVEFSKDLIREAIGASKELNDAQIKNLHKYVVLVPSLS